MKFGISLSTLHPGLHLGATLEAERLGFESAWLAEHLVFPVDMSGSPHPGADAPPVPPSVPVYDAFAYLCYLAGRTSKIRLGTNVYLLGLRHPFVAARSIQTLDVVSGGRAEVGIGAGWLRSEWTAAGLDPRTRGRRLDEALSVCKRLWTEEVIAHHGEFYSFDSVMFEPKPIQKPWPKIHVGGESRAALRRAAAHADGWFGLVHTPESACERVAELRRECAEAGRSQEKLEVTLSVTPGDCDEVRRFADAGVDRLVVSPWRRSRECIPALRRFAEVHSITPIPGS